jgi:two-component system, NarL family, nitrate/nitrite response regulator NarL
MKPTLPLGIDEAARSGGMLKERGPMRLVLCDKNRILCEALGSALEAQGHQGVALPTTAAGGQAAVAAHRPDLIILDPGVPAGNGAAGNGAAGNGAAFPAQAPGLGAAEAMRRDHPCTAVLLLSGHVDRATWSAAVKIGIAGYLGRNQALGQITAALDTIAAGGVVFDPGVPSQPGERRPSKRRAPLYRLTPREKEVLRRIVAGQNTVQMAREMNIAIDTLRTYVKNVLAKLGAHTRLQAAALASREDLLGEMSA